MWECVVCHKQANCWLEHMETKNKYPFCDLCENEGFYNNKVFTVDHTPPQWRGDE